ncbi:protein boule-like [Plectropomus leopardus]|uniref:protein boule-like n=1 Tax=Plectropomus leopardus TaxID=160734 RepID=UPI001C4D4720|nr:protein boule-like [Plectropomus leopardus]
MEAENKEPEGGSSSTPDVLPPQNKGDTLTHHTFSHSTVIPSRIFVGGIDSKINESDLRQAFSKHGAIKEVKIVNDCSGVSKGYGFVTFENKSDAQKILHDVNGITVKNKWLIIARAVRKQQASGRSRSAHGSIPNSAGPLPMSCGTLYLNTSTGYPYTYHNGVAYFHRPSMDPLAYHWPQPPVMLQQSYQPVFQQPAYNHHQYALNQYQWNVFQSQMPSSPVLYSQQSEYLQQPADVQAPLLVSDTTPQFVKPPVQQVYPLHPQTTDGLIPVLLQHNHGKNRRFPHLRVHQTPKYRKYIHHKDYRHLPEATEPPDASTLYSQQLLK